MREELLKEFKDSELNIGNGKVLRRLSGYIREKIQARLNMEERDVFAEKLRQERQEFEERLVEEKLAWKKKNAESKCRIIKGNQVVWTLVCGSGKN